MCDLAHLPVSPRGAGCFRDAETQLGGKAESDASSVQVVLCVEHKAFLRVVWELDALEPFCGGWVSEGL